MIFVTGGSRYVINQQIYVVNSALIIVAVVLGCRSSRCCSKMATRSRALRVRVLLSSRRLHVSCNRVRTRDGLLTIASDSQIRLELPCYSGRLVSPPCDALRPCFDHVLPIYRADPKTATAAVQKTISTFGRLDSLILNASTVYPITRLADAKVEEIVAGFQTNVFSIVPVIQAASSELRKSKLPGGARIIALSSAAGLSGIAGMGPYCASKAALNILIGYASPNGVWPRKY